MAKMFYRSCMNTSMKKFARQLWNTVDIRGPLLNHLYSVLGRLYTTG